jgi:putative transposase
LSKAAARYECAIHAYALMTNHVHLLATPAGVGSVARMMQSIGRSCVRAGLVQRAENYRWSSYAARVREEPNNVINDHPLYLAMGKDANERMLAYRALFSDPMDDDQKLIRREINRSGALGGDRFRDEIEAALARRVRPGKAGRPKVQNDPRENRAKQGLILL